MKDQLIKLAKEKGFTTETLKICEISNSFYYIWLCELQKWLREKRGIVLNIEFNFSKLNYDVFQYKKENDEGKHIIEECATYEEALEFGLFEALKLIK